MGPLSLPISSLAALVAAAALACNAATSVGLLLVRRKRSRRPRLATTTTTAAAASAPAVALTALQHWTGGGDLDDDDADDTEGGLSSSPSLRMALQLLLTLASCQALATAPRQRPLYSTVGPLLLLMPLARLDPLSAAVLAAAALAMHAATALTPLLDGRRLPPGSLSPRSFLLPMAAPAIALLWALLLAVAPHPNGDEDELLGAPSAASWRPDTGLWWYLMTEAFHGFQPYFRLVLAAHPFLYLAPMAVRIAGSKGSSKGGGGAAKGPSPRRMTLFLLVALATAHVFRPKPQPAHLAALLAAFLLLLPPATLHGLRYKLLLCGVGLGVPATLLPVMQHLWLRARAGNANYAFFQGFVWNVFWTLLVLEMALVVVKFEDGGKAEKDDVEKLESVKLY